MSFSLKSFFSNIPPPSWFWFCFLCILLCSTALHLYKLENLPLGLYTDEASIGYNAFSIAQTGVDEWGRHWPVFFEAFGEWKNPLYIYTVALFFKLFGVSTYLLRFVSFFYFFFFQIAFSLFAWRLFKDRRIVLLSLLFTSVVPYLFLLSRVSFELLSLLPFLVLFLFFWHFASSLHTTFISRLYYFFFAGISAGLMLYTYSTARLFVPILIVITAVLYYRQLAWRPLVAFLFGFLGTSSMYLWFSITHSTAMTARFRALSYIYDSSLTFYEKAHLFLVNYTSYFSLDFLVFSGDGNLRHHIGYGGQFSVVIFVLFLVGLFVWVAFQYYKNKFWLLLFCLLFLSPVAASLTLDSEHALRSHIILPFILLFSLLGFSKLIEYFSHYRSVLSFGIVFLVLFEALFYIHFFFVQYPAHSIPYFSSYGFEELFSDFMSRKGDYEIIIDPEIGSTVPYIYVLYYSSLFHINVLDPVPFSSLYHFSNHKVVHIQRMVQNGSCTLSYRDNIYYSKHKGLRSIIQPTPDSLVVAYCF